MTQIEIWYVENEIIERLDSGKMVIIDSTILLDY